MITQIDMDLYPNTPGWKKRPTSKRAAAEMAINKAGLQYDVMWALWHFGPLTADECADKLGLNILSIRPRLSELCALGWVSDSGKRRPNRSGKNAIVWRRK